MFFPDAPVPKRIGEYRVLRRVTVEEPFEVYVAKEEGALGFSREVTLRCLKRDEDANRAAELAREARICTRLKHPSIEHVLGLVEERDRFVLVLEHAEGVTCETLLEILEARDEQLPFAAAAYIAGTVATALAAAHAHQGDSGLKAPILHRAIGPAVVHVAMDGTVKLGGFGLAKILDRTPDSAVGLTGGTRRLSPEQKKGAPATEKSDVWSLGALCYTLFGGGGGAPLLETIVGRPPKLDSVRSDVPLELAAAIDAALEEDPANRSISSAEIARWIARTTPLEEGHRVLRALLESIPKEELGEPAAERGLRRVRAMERRASRGKILRKSMSERVSDSELEEVQPEAPPPVLMPTGRTNTISGVGPSSVRAVAAAPVAPDPPARVPTPPRIPTPAKIATPPPIVVAPQRIPTPEPVPAPQPIAPQQPVFAPQPMPALASKPRSVPIASIESLDDTQVLPRAPRRRRKMIAIAAATFAVIAIVIVAVVLTRSPTPDVAETKSKPVASTSETVAAAPSEAAPAKTPPPIDTAPASSASATPPKKKLPPEYGWLLVHSPPGKVMVAGKGRGPANEVIATPCGKLYVAVAKVDSKDKWIGWAAKGQPFTIPCDGTVGEITLGPPK